MTTYLSDTQVTGTILQAERITDVPPELFWLRPNNAPLVKLTAGRGADGLPLKKRVAVNPKFDVLEKEPHGVWTAINLTAGYTAGDTDLVVDSADHIPVGAVCKVVGGELLYVSARNTSTETLTVTRGYGTTAAGVIADNTPIYCIGNVNEEHGAIPTALMVQNRSRTNYTQILRKPFGLSRTLANSEMYHGKKGPELNREAFLEFERIIERAFLFGEPKEALTGGPNSRPIRMTGGVNYWIDLAGNVTTATTTFTIAMWLTFQRTAFEYGSEQGEDTKVFLCSYFLAEMFDYWKKDGLRFQPSDEFYNIKVAEFISAQGRVILLPDRELKNSPAGSGAGYGGTGFMLDTGNQEYRYLQNSDMKLYENVVRAGADGYTNEYLAEVGFGIENPECFSKLTAVTTYA